MKKLIVLLVTFLLASPSYAQFAGGGGSGAADGVGYDRVQEDGVDLTKRANLNMIGASVTCVDNAGSVRTDCTVVDNVGVDQIQKDGTNLTKRANVNFIGRDVTCVDNSGSTRTDCTMADPATYVHLFDDFIGGTGNTTTVGTLNWVFTGTFNSINGVAGRPGLIELDTSATINTTARLSLRTASSYPIVPSDSFDAIFVAKLVTGDSSDDMLVGLVNSVGGLPPNDGVWIEKLGADTSWFCVARASSIQTRSTAILTVDTSFHKFRVRRVDGSTVGCSIDGGTEKTITTNIPTVALAPEFRNLNETAVDRHMQIDYFDLVVSGLNR